MRFIEGLGGFSRLLETWAIELPLAVNEATEASAKAVKKVVQSIYGTDKLADLAEATQDERTSLGYAANEPLYRTGELLRDSVEIERPSMDTAIIGSSEPIHAYHEYGYWNVRAGHAVPARPVFKIASVEALPLLASIAQDSVAAVLFGGRVRRLFSSSASADIQSAARSGATDTVDSMRQIA